jgi:hypothetical protein
MALFAVGNFSGAADGTALSTADPNFVIHPFTSGAVATVESGRIVATATGNSIYYHSGIPASADYSVSADFYRSSAGAGSMGVCGRVNATAATFYMGRYSTVAGAWQLYRSIANVFSLLGSQYADTFSAGQTKTARLTMSGSTIALHKEHEAAPIVSVTDLGISAIGKAGFRNTISANSIHISTFVGSDPFPAFLAAAGQNQVIQNA